MQDTKDIKSILAQIKCFLLDMDGTFYLGDRLIDGSLDFLSALKATGRTARFLTNNSSKSAAVYANKLQKMNVPEEYRDVISSGHAAARYCLSHYPGQAGYLLGNEMLRAELEGMGLCFTDRDPAYVLIGFDTTLTYEKLCTVCDFIRAGLPYIATHPDINCPTDGGFIPDVGSFISLIESSTGRKPDLILGKPYTGIVEEALARTGFSPEEIAIVGDRLYTDVATAVKHGMLGILVMSGETDEEILRRSEIQPDLIFDRLASMIPWL